MKKIIISSLLCILSSTSFATVHDNDKNFCTAFVDESIAMCNQSGAGGCAISKNYTGMQTLYGRLCQAGGGKTQAGLRRGCQIATLKIHQPGELENCVAKWNCYNGAAEAKSSCINPRGVHCSP